MDNINAGILGAGFMGQKHANNLEKQNGVQVKAICDQNEENANKLANKLVSNTKVFSNFQKMINDVNLDVIYICLPPFAHNEQIQKAAEKGVHLFIEKPIALSTDEAAEMVSAIKKADIISQVGYHKRFGDAVSRLKKLIDNGTAGIPTLFDARYECNSLHSPWWKNKDKSGGQVFEQAIHLYDLAMYFLGEPTDTSGLMANLCHNDVDGYSVEDTSVSIIKFRTGALANIAATNCAVPGEWNYPFTVVCENLTAYFKDANNAEIVYTEEENIKKENINSEHDMYLAETISFIDAVRGKVSNSCTIEDGYRSLKLVESVVKSSAKLGETINLTK